MSNHFTSKLKQWGQRKRMAAEIVNSLPLQCVYDLGCGDGSFKDLLVDKKYVGYDYSGKCVRIDLNKDFPLISTPGIGVMLGLLEYIESLDTFVAHFGSCFPHIVLSYNMLDLSVRTTASITSLGWISILRQPDFETLLQKEYLIIQRTFLHKTEFLYHLRRKE